MEAVAGAGGDVVFDWRLSRRHGELTSLLNGYKGLLQSDAYGAYETHVLANQGVTALGCMAHARRKFYDALKSHPREATLVLKLIARTIRVGREQGVTLVTLIRGLSGRRVRVVAHTSTSSAF